MVIRGKPNYVMDHMKTLNSMKNDMAAATVGTRIAMSAAEQREDSGVAGATTSQVNLQA